MLVVKKKRRGGVDGVDTLGEKAIGKEGEGGNKEKGWGKRIDFRRERWKRREKIVPKYWIQFMFLHLESDFDFL